MESLHILLRFRQHLLDAFLVAGGHTAHTFHDGVGGGTLLVVGVVAILAAEVVIVAVVGEGSAGTGIDTSSAAVAKVTGNVGIAIVTAHQRGIGEHQADAVPRAIFSCKKPLAPAHHTLARTSHHA